MHSALDQQGNASEKVLLYVYLNAANETGFVNPIDEAIRHIEVGETADWRKLDEIPYDFLRKRISVLLEWNGRRIVIAKGPLRQILDVSSRAELSDGSIIPLDSVRAEVRRQSCRCSNEGHRVLAVAYRDCSEQTQISRSDETDMVFMGLIVLSDPPKAGIAATIRELRDLGITLKIITGDNTLIAEQVAREVGFDAPRVLTGSEMRNMSAQALIHRAPVTDGFAEIEPTQKERIIVALKKAGQVVGYIGDGINDAPALRAADVSLSVESAVDVAREAADFVLFEHDLEVLVDGVREGRRTFANTLKYVFIATSANFGNMFSMAGASLFLTFLPLLPKQILLINLLTNLPEMTIAGDNVDPELVQAPRRWDIKFIRKFMLVFGILSSLFDCLTFFALVWLGATTEQFRTGWFIESVVSASLIVLVVRSCRPFFKSRPSKLLAIATGAVVVAAFLMPRFQLAALLGFTQMPIRFYTIAATIVLLYVVSAELAKRVFYRAAATARKSSQGPACGIC